MRKLSKETFNEINSYMNKEARDLEKAIFNYYFNNSDGNHILDILEKYQNSDGGFGRGIEPDFKLVESSPMGTSIGLRYLHLLGDNARAQKMIAKAIEYLESTFDKKRNGWYSVPATVNDYPHAPHWKYRNDIGMTVIDYSWGNPTAELIGYLYRYRGYLKQIDIFSLLNYAISRLNEQIEFDSDNLFGIDKKFIDRNLDYLIRNLEEDRKIYPTWEWDDYLDEWKAAKTEWMGNLTLEASLFLMKFNRIEIN